MPFVPLLDPPGDPQGTSLVFAVRGTRVVLVDGERRVRYAGRIDDRYKIRGVMSPGTPDAELREAIQEMLDHKGPYVLDVIVPYTEHVLPFIPQKKSAMEILTK